jgi:hypothetical protein
MGEMPPVLVAALIAVAVVVSAAPAARADPWFDADQGPLEDRFADGDLDEEDHIAAALGHRQGTTDVRGESWVSLSATERLLGSGKNDFGAIVVVGLALDRWALGGVHRVADPPAPAKPAAPTTPDPTADPAPLRPGLAHECVAAAWRAAGVGAGDERIDSIESRSRSSALLPETRLRAMRLWTDASHATTLATTDGTNYYDAVGANLVLEVRLTWRLDRALYAGDEPTLERVRMERSEARNRLADRVLQALFAWAKASQTAAAAAAGSLELREASLHVAEAAATLDVLTGGWFSEQSIAKADR